MPLRVMVEIDQRGNERSIGVTGAWVDAAENAQPCEDAGAILAALQTALNVVANGVDLSPPKVVRAAPNGMRIPRSR